MKPYEEWTEDDYARERRRMEGSFITFAPVPQEVEDYIRRAYNARDWSWRTSDGGTGTGEKYWKTKYFPPYVGHDYICIKAKRAMTFRSACRIRKIGDLLMRKALAAYGIGPWRFVEYWAVRRYWLFVGRWKVKAAIEKRNKRARG